MQSFSIAETAGRLGAANVSYLRLIEKSSFDIGFYKSDGEDRQTAHTRDELYVVAAGTGEFTCDGETRGFKLGDLFFVPAGVEHRFVNFTADFATWVVFFGPRA